MTSTFFAGLIGAGIAGASMFLLGLKSRAAARLPDEADVPAVVAARESWSPVLIAAAMARATEQEATELFEPTSRHPDREGIYA